MVVHVVYHEAEENISDAQIRSQIVALNRDFQNLQADLSDVDASFINGIGNPNINFVLVEEPELAIKRIATDVVVFGNKNISSTSSGGFDGWDSDLYFNIWVGNLLPGVKGWAVTDASSQTNVGVVIDYEYFGTEGTALPDYDLGRTLVHEVGHWLELQHLEGALGSCFTDDDILDTPIQNTAITSCSGTQEQCGNKIMTQNFMQIGEDACLLFFTSGQVAKMRETLLSDHSSLINNANEILALLNGLNQLTQLNYIEGKLMIKVNQPGLYDIQLINLEGQAVVNFEQQFIREDYSKEIKELNEGIYLVHIKSAENYVTQRIYVDKE